MKRFPQREGIAGICWDEKFSWKRKGNEKKKGHCWKIPEPGMERVNPDLPEIVPSRIPAPSKGDFATRVAEGKKSFWELRNGFWKQESVEINVFFHKYSGFSADPNFPRKNPIWFSILISKNWFFLGPVSFPWFDFLSKHSWPSLSSIRPFPISGSTSRWKILGIQGVLCSWKLLGKPRRGKTIALQTPQPRLDLRQNLHFIEGKIHVLFQETIPYFSPEKCWHHSLPPALGFSIRNSADR